MVMSMASPQEVFRQILKDHGYSVTEARMAVFKALVGQEPMSMHSLIGLAVEVDRASVYRAIDLFEKLGIVQRLNTGWKYKIELTDRFNDHHHHISCTECGKTVAMNEQELEQFIEALARQHGFALKSHQIEIQGVCTNCQIKE
jgi:Fur family ferric uptake transcriptional regulator